MQVTSISTHTYRPWDYDTPNLTGIGGSETNAIEWASRLADRGHDVLVYIPCDWEGVREHRGARWTSCAEPDYSREGVWLINRDPVVCDHFPVEHPRQKLWFVAQDTFYWHMTEERAAKLDRYICLCQAHAQYVASIYPYLKDKICISGNGTKVELIEQIENGPNPPVRDPRKLIFASSPDRGLLPLLKIFRRAYEWFPTDRLELHVFYGFQNALKTWELLGSKPKHPTKVLYDTCMEEFKKPGVVWHNRTPQPELYRHWLSAGFWVHPSTFTETNCITAQDAQATGAIPICTPIWAVGEYVQHGVFVQGDPNSDPLTIARYVGELVRMVNDTDAQEQIRSEMMPWARKRFSWERSVDDLCNWMVDRPKHSIILLAYDPENKLSVMTTDCIARIYERCNGAEVIVVNRKGQASALKEGLEKATGEFIHVVCNDVMIKDPNWLEKMARPHEVTSWGPTTFVLTGATELEMSLFCIPRDVYNAVGGWDTDFDGGYGYDDVEWLGRVRDAGFNTRIVPVAAEHLCGQTFRAYNRPEDFRALYNRNMDLFKQKRAHRMPPGGWRDYQLPEVLY